MQGLRFLGEDKPGPALDFQLCSSPLERRQAPISLLDQPVPIMDLHSAAHHHMFCPRPPRMSASSSQSSMTSVESKGCDYGSLVEQDCLEVSMLLDGPDSSAGRTGACSGYGSLMQQYAAHQVAERPRLVIPPMPLWGSGHTSRASSSESSTPLTVSPSATAADARPCLPALKCPGKQPFQSHYQPGRDIVAPIFVEGDSDSEDGSAGQFQHATVSTAGGAPSALHLQTHAMQHSPLYPQSMRGRADQLHSSVDPATADLMPDWQLTALCSGTPQDLYELGLFFPPGESSSADNNGHAANCRRRSRAVAARKAKKVSKSSRENSDDEEYEEGDLDEDDQSQGSAGGPDKPRKKASEPCRVILMDWLVSHKGECSLQYLLMLLILILGQSIRIRRRERRRNWPGAQAWA